MGKVIKGLLKLLKILVLLIFVAGLIVGGIFIVKQKKKNLMAEKPPEPAPLPVNTAQITKGFLDDSKRYLATLEPKAKTSIIPRITGQLVKFLVTEGDRVKKGDLLAEIDSRQQRAKINSLYAQLKAAKSSLSTYKKIYQRDKELFQNKAISREAFDRSKSAYDNALAKVKELESLLSAAKVELSYTQIVAPFDGIITSKFAEKGSMALAGRPLFEMESTEKGYKLVLKVPQKVFPKIKEGLEAEVLPLKKGQKPIKATISRLYPSSLPSCEIDLDSRPFGLPSRSHLYVKVQLNKIRGFILPARALLEQATGPALIFLSTNNKVEKVAVNILARSEDQVCVEPLTEIDLARKQVITAGEDILLRLKKGQKVRPLNPSQTRGS